MARYSDQTVTLIADVNVPVQGVSVYVYNRDGSLATLTADGGGALTNPVVSDQYGNFYFNAADGLYDLSFHYGGKQVDQTNGVQVGVGPVLPAEILAALSQPTADSLIGHVAVGTGAVATTVQAALRDFGVNVRQFGAKADGSNDSAAINAAIATGAKTIYFPSGNYHCHGLTGAIDGQQFIGLGAVNLIRNATGSLLNFTAADILFRNIVWWGDLDSIAYTGDLVTLSGARNQLHECAARFQFSDGGIYKVLVITGGASKIVGVNDSYVGKVVVGQSGVPCLYASISDAYFAYSLTLIDTGHCSIRACIFSDLTIDRGAGTSGSHGPDISSCRVVGVLTVTQSQTCVGSNTTVSGLGTVIVGDGVNAASGITFDPSFSIGVATSGFGSFTLNTLISDSVFYLLNIPTANTVTINSPINAIWDTPRTYTPALTASGGSPAKGAGGSLTGTIFRNGYERRATIQFVFGTGSNLGTGESRISVPDACGPSNYGFGGGNILDSGTGSKPITPRIAPSAAYMVFITDTTSGAVAANALDSTTPITFASGDNILASVIYSVK